MAPPTARPGLAARAGAAFAAYRDGDAQRLSELIELLNPLLWQLARAQGASAATSEDAVQTGWLRLVHHADRIDEPAAVLGWLIVTVRRETWRLLAKERREIDVERVPEATDPAPGPELRVQTGQRDAVLSRHLTRLSPRCRELLSVIAFADKPDYASIAASLGMPIGSIGPTRGRCLQYLRTALENDPEWGWT